MQPNSIPRNPFSVLMLVIILLGIFFRFANLDGKIYWHDEVYTNFRSSGYTAVEINQSLFQNQWLTPQDLKKYQEIKPNSTLSDTLNSLATEDPQHPPLYFILARFWLQLFGNSLTTNRLLPALLSLFSFLFIYLLARELFASDAIGLLAMALYAISPIHILFDQTARQYGLLTTEIIASSFFLLKAVKFPKYWLAYIVATTLGLYTHPFMVLTTIGHGFYLIGLRLKKLHPWSHLVRYLEAIALSFALYLPWIAVMIGNSQQGISATNWTTLNSNFLSLVKGWIFCFGSILLDFDFGSNNLDNPWTYVIKLPAIALMLWAIYVVCSRTHVEIYWFILTGIFVPFLLLALPDVLFGGIRSVVPRYLLNSFPAIQLAIAYALHQILLRQKTFSYFIFSLVFTLSILSNSSNFLLNTSWTKDISYYNAQVIKIINASSSPIIITDMADSFSKMPHLLSLSYNLDPKVRLFLLKSPPNPQLVQEVVQNTEGDIFTFEPSEPLKEILETLKPLDFVFPPGKLYKIFRQPS